MVKYHKQLLGFGIGLGMCFPLLGLTLDMFLQGFAFSWSAILLLHQVNPLHLIIDSAPLVLGMIFYFLGKNIKERESKLQELNRSIVNKCDSISEYVEALNNNDFDVVYNYQDEDDKLRVILHTFQDNLKQKNDRERIRTWTNDGLANFGELIRSDTNDISSFCQAILSNLINYMEMNQGAIFVVNDETEQPCLELLACYAWGKKRYLYKKIGVGETVIGQCWAEREKIYLADVPEDFIEITSGLGKSLPRNIIILPLKIKDKIYGVIELASFQYLESFHIEFLEKISESIASVLHTFDTNNNVLSLLKQTQQQTKELQSQEEEMRQNMEEMKATQEEQTRKEQQYLLTIQQLEASLKTN